MSELDETTSPAATDEDRERSSVDDGAPGEEDDGPAPPADTRIMTNEERVAHLLDAHGGRMLQSEMVEADDWSKATVSRVLSRMEEEGSVTRVDIGRGNLVTRPEDEPPNVDSPFED